MEDSKRVSLEGNQSPGVGEIQDDIRRLVEYYHTNTRTINNLFRGGVSLKDLDEVLAMRDFLSVELENYGGGTIGQDVVSSAALAEAYTAVGGDMEELRSLAEDAKDLAMERMFFGAHSSALRAIVELYRDGDLGQFRSKK